MCYGTLLPPRPGATVRESEGLYLQCCLARLPFLRTKKRRKNQNRYQQGQRLLPRTILLGVYDIASLPLQMLVKRHRGHKPARGNRTCAQRVRTGRITGGHRGAQGGAQEVGTGGECPRCTARTRLPCLRPGAPRLTSHPPLPAPGPTAPGHGVSSQLSGDSRLKRCVPGAGGRALSSDLRMRK